MSDDLVERLRAYNIWDGTNNNHPLICKEAADEISRLRTMHEKWVRDHQADTDAAWRKAESARAEGFALAKQMHEALRKLVVMPAVSGAAGFCELCGSDGMYWELGDAEVHRDNCLASPDAIPERKP